MIFCLLSSKWYPSLNIFVEIKAGLAVQVRSWLQQICGVGFSLNEQVSSSGPTNSFRVDLVAVYDVL